MKIQKYLIGLLLAVLFTIVIVLNCNAAVTVERVWEGSSRSITAGERVQLEQYRITTDAAVNIEGVIIKSTGPVHLVFDNILLRNGFGRVIGKGRPSENDDLTSVILEKTVVLPGMYQFVTLEAESTTSLSPEAARHGVNLSVIEIITSDDAFALSSLNTTYQMLTGRREVGTLSLSRLGTPSTVFVGQMQFLGGFSVTSDSDITGMPIVGIHVINGTKDDVRNLVALALNAKGEWFFAPIVRQIEFGDLLDRYAIQTNIHFAPGITLIGVFADIGGSFSNNGGSIAVSTTPSEWQVWDSRGRAPVLSGKTVVGPTIRVQQGSGGKG